jgi:hypothetical protein
MSILSFELMGFIAVTPTATTRESGGEQAVSYVFLQGKSHRNGRPLRQKKTNTQKTYETHPYTTRTN